MSILREKENRKTVITNDIYEADLYEVFKFIEDSENQ